MKFCGMKVIKADMPEGAQMVMVSGKQAVALTTDGQIVGPFYHIKTNTGSGKKPTPPPNDA